MNFIIGNKYTKYIFAVALFFWMGVIFYMSAESADDSTQTSGFLVDTVAKILGIEFYSQSYWTLTTVIRKLAHLTEFALLGGLAFINVCHYELKNMTRLVTSFVIGVLYAVSDEVHQIFVAGRACRFTDVLIDSFGVSLGIIFVFLVLCLYFKNKRRKQ